MWQILSHDCCLLTMSQEKKNNEDKRQTTTVLSERIGRYSPALSRSVSDSWQLWPGRFFFFFLSFFLLLFESKGTCKQPFCAIGTAGKARPIEWGRRWGQLTLTTGVCTAKYVQTEHYTLEISASPSTVSSSSFSPF